MTPEELKELREKYKNAYENILIAKFVDDLSFPTQTLKRYFVEPEIFIINENTGEKQPIKLQNIFSPVVGLPQPEKILLIGNNGAGKSTILDRILSIKIDLRLLLSNSWRDDYLGDNAFTKDPISCLAHHTLKLIPNQDMTLSEVHEMLYDGKHRRDDITIAIDGYDEVTHLVNKPTETANKIFNEALGFKKVIMASRSSALTGAIESKFDRIIEINKLDGNGVDLFVEKYFTEQYSELKDIVESVFNNENEKNGKDLLYIVKRKNYELFIQLKKIPGLMTINGNKDFFIELIKNHYQETKHSLSSLLLENSSIKELASNPMNAAMLCLFYSDPVVRGRLKDFTINELYKEVIIMIGKRSIWKTDKTLDFNDISAEQVLTSPEITVLKQIAYAAFKNNNLIEEGFVETEAATKRLSAKKLCDFGLLKKVYSHLDGEVNGHAHAFVHLSIQEYLAASELTDKLSSTDEDAYKEAAYFVAHHRNDPKYLMLLKFTAGMLSKLDGKENIAITRFWEAVECNIDGVLELGVENKVALLMHLLQQVKSNGIIDPRVANLDKVIKFIDKIILNDITSWKEEIKLSGYLSPAMEEYLLRNSKQSILYQDNNEEKNDSSNENLVEKVNPLKSLSSKKSFYVKDKAPISPIFKTKIIIEILGSLLNKFDNEKLLKSLSSNLKEGTNWQIVRSSINVISKIIDNNRNQIAEDEKQAIPEEIAFIITSFTDFIHNQNLAEYALNGIKIIFEAYKNYKNYHKTLISLLDNLIPLTATNTHNKELSQLLVNIITGNDKLAVDYALNQFVAVINGHKVRTASLEREISDENDERNLRESNLQYIIGIIDDLIQARQDPALAFQIIDKLAETLDVNAPNPNTFFVISRIVTLNNNFQTQQAMFNEFIKKLSDESSQEQAIFAINSIIKGTIKINNEFAEIILKALVSLMNQSNKIETKNDIILAISNVAGIADGMALDIRKEVLATLINAAIENPKVFLAMVNVAGVDEELLKQVFNELSTFIGQDPKNIDLIENPLNKITSKAISPNLAQVIFDTLKPKLDSNNPKVITSIANLVPKIKITTEEINQIQKKFIELLKMFETAALQEEITSALYLVSNKNQDSQQFLFEAIVQEFKSFLNNENALKVGTSIVKLIIKLIKVVNVSDVNNLFDLLYIALIDNRCDAMVLSKAISNLSNAYPQYTSNLINKLLDLINLPDSDVHINAIYIVDRIVEKQEIALEHRQSLLNEMVKYLDTPQASLSAIKAASKILAQHEDDGSNAKKILIKLIPLIDSLTKEAVYTVHAIAQILKNTQVDDKELNDILVKLGDFGDSKEYASEIEESITKIINVMTLKGAISLLKNEHLVIRNIAAKVLTNKISAEQNYDSWESTIENMLSIVGDGSERNDLAVKKLYDAARKLLQHKILQMDTKNLSWIFEKFDDLIKISGSEAKVMMELIFSQALSDFIITELESKFILKCIANLGFTVTIRVVEASKNENNEVEFMFEFGDEIYYLKGEENRGNVREIANAAIKNSQDLVSLQYQTYQAVFKNTGSGISEAAIDIKECLSLLDKANEKEITNTGSEMIETVVDIEEGFGSLNKEYLNSNKWKFSIVYLSNAARDEPTSAFALLETREPLGYCHDYKIYVSSKTNKIKVVQHTSHPQAMDMSFKEKIFTQKREENTHPRYYSQTFDISLEDGINLIQHANPAKSNPREGYANSRTSRPGEFGEKPIGKHSPASPEKSSSGNMGNYKSSLDQFYDFINQHISLTNRGISKDWETNIKTGLEEHTRFDLGLEKDRSNSNGVDLSLLVDQSKLSHKAKAEVLSIEKDPYKNAFYSKIIAELYAADIGSSAVHSGIVKNSKQGALGKAGAFIDGVSAFIPISGAEAVISIFTQILQSVDENIQKEYVENFFIFARKGNAMEKVTEMIARQLALAELNIVKATGSLLAAGLNAASNVMQAGVGGNIVAIGYAFKDGITAISEELSLKELEDRRGSNDGAIVVREIIQNIFVGKYAEATNVNEDKADLVAKDIKEVYRLPMAGLHITHEESPAFVLQAEIADDLELIVDVTHETPTASALAPQGEIADIVPPVVPAPAPVPQVEVVGGPNARAGGCLPWFHCWKFEVEPTPYILALEQISKLPKEERTLALREFFQRKTIIEDVNLQREEIASASSDKAGEQACNIQEENALVEVVQPQGEEVPSASSDKAGEQAYNIQTTLYKATLGFKALDTTIDLVKLYHEPTMNNGRAALKDSSYLYSAYYGANGYSSLIAAADVIDNLVHGEITQAFKQAAFSLSYMALPIVMAYVGVPSTTYVGAITLYSGYGSLNTAYNYYQEYNQPKYALKSANTYKALSEFLATSSINNIYDFTDLVKASKITINNINLETEKTEIKQKLGELGEFGQKLYDHIYLPLLEEKYDVLNDLLIGNEKEDLSVKLVNVTIEGQVYDFCLEQKLTKDHFYCYNNEQKIIDQVVIGENSSE